MKRSLFLLLVLFTLVSIVGCGESKKMNPQLEKRFFDSTVETISNMTEFIENEGNLSKPKKDQINLYYQMLREGNYPKHSNDQTEIMNNMVFLNYDYTMYGEAGYGNNAIKSFNKFKKTIEELLYK